MAALIDEPPRKSQISPVRVSFNASSRVSVLTSTLIECAMYGSGLGWPVRWVSRPEACSSFVISGNRWARLTKKTEATCS